MADKAWFLFVCGVISKLIVGQRSDLERSDHGTNLEQRPFNFFIIRWIQIYTTYLTMDNFICWIRVDSIIHTLNNRYDAGVKIYPLDSDLSGG